MTNAILAYAQNIENLPAMASAVERIANKHVGLQIEPRHYDHVVSALLAAIKAVLKEAATEEVIRAWGEAYWFLANILIGREEQLYQYRTQHPAHWALTKIPPPLGRTSAFGTRVAAHHRKRRWINPATTSSWAGRA
ncbi:globin domain-containing protein [Leisingera sp. M658]|uniref:globin domain-containing protein n=1 Tax=Leisingera sp. M658 TaxID=2867015 RepID=UPI0021A80A32|nr:globin domain-containing protein [Leisingera sp. M658]UWQ75847.1 hypothetical protein K3724_05170 [Leisingera sp. M658]